MSEPTTLEKLETENKALKGRLDLVNERWRALDQERHQARIVLRASDLETTVRAAKRAMQRISDLEDELDNKNALTFHTVLDP
jgi:predicted RNase H-like nuclease (RuvC/YqgF family)